MRRLIFFLLILALAGYLPVLWLRSTGTVLTLREEVKVIGVATPIGVVAVNPHGVREFRAVLEQGGQAHTLFLRNEPGVRWNLFRKQENPRSYEFEAGTRKTPGLRNGRASLRLEAISNDLRARTDSLALEVEVNTRPPAISVDEGQHYITLGGSEVVAFSVSGYWTEAGVRVGKYRFRSFAREDQLPGPGRERAARRICLFAYPYDTPEGEVPVIYARNPAGAEVTARFWHKLFRKQFRMREILVSEAFLNKVLQELDRGGTGEPVARFIKVNSDLRKQNHQTLAELRLQTADRPLWSGPFLQLANSSVEAQFCDYRRYFYHGQSIDEQVHLGFDLAVTANTPVAAANDGKVIHAAPLGIYGNTIVVDHGLALQSIYAHLSRMQVKPGDAVKKGQIIGRSGSTGMAGGDHLHFSMQVDGVPVNPIEWWDSHWIQDRVLSNLRYKPEKH
ncbi:MAG: M23 family metallopeptidase [Acidobacteria bacterium]|nr:M23 family metallopeptidase [Acidobacteriota bacterium]